MSAQSYNLPLVVYCFQNCIFVGEFTASKSILPTLVELCIAFKIVSL